MRFLIFEKWMTKENVPGILRFVNILLLIFEKAMSRKIVPRILGFLSMFFFNICKKDGQKNCIRNFKVLKYALLLII